ncbi:restriction endonuclease subunit S [Pseudarthrobacter sp. RMG13]|uniref:Restriction endonuclease subunit S n=1 Tax=Pseudarthrobacter humi TaxID=2952523 RepID=A0ABT1LUC7_9MICC|nr:restriction endonuclease subunit S [Pseudarthrobacter humi]MCP9002079.1 restriction endonuclease subunit S [Pseudarthrobacter humi]
MTEQAVANKLAVDRHGEFVVKRKAVEAVAAVGEADARGQRRRTEMIALGWSNSNLDDVTLRGSGHTPSQQHPEYWDGDIEWVSLADSGKLDQGYISASTRRITARGMEKSSAVLHPAGTVIMSRDAGVGKSAILREAMAVSQHFIAWECKAKGVLEPWYLYYWLQSRKGYFERMAVGSTIKTIGLPLFRKLTISHPPLPEQRKIADILRTWDEAIDRAETLMRAEIEAFGVLRRRLFLFRGHEVPLSEVSMHITTKSDGAPHTVMAISAKTGFVAQADKYRRDMAGANLTNYTLLRRGEFAYNKGNSLTYPQGCIYALKEHSALVPNVYYSFRLRADLNSSYYEHFFASGALNRQLAQRITSGVRGNGLLNLNADDFFGVKVPVPSRATQDGAADALNMGARKIELLQHKAELLRTQKRGLMQKLLTGQLRVNVAAEIEPGGPDDD